MSALIEAVILGCGSSGGVPRCDGEWGACDPTEPRNRRLRSSLLVRKRDRPGQEPTVILIDTSPDLREQMLAAGVTRVDAVLYTHDHADQVHGVDDLRAFAIRDRRRIPCWADEATRATMQSRFGYVFQSLENYPAICDLNALPPIGQPFVIDGPGGEVTIQTFDQAHGPIRSVGYRIGPLAYSPDVSGVDQAALDEVGRARLWIVDALRWTPHPTHAHVDLTLDWIARSGVERAILTNLHIDLDYATLAARLPANVAPAFDGLTITLEA